MKQGRTSASLPIRKLCYCMLSLLHMYIWFCFCCRPAYPNTTHSTILPLRNPGKKLQTLDSEQQHEGTTAGEVNSSHSPNSLECQDPRFPSRILHCCEVVSVTCCDWSVYVLSPDITPCTLLLAGDYTPTAQRLTPGNLQNTAKY